MTRIALTAALLLMLAACEPKRNPLEPPAPRPDDPVEPRTSEADLRSDSQLFVAGWAVAG